MSSKVIFDNQILGVMRSFENVTHSKLRDCIVEDDKIIFVVSEGELRKAIGKEGSNAKRLSEILKKKVKMVEFSNDVIQLISNFIHPLKAKNISQEDGIITIETADSKTRGLLIGRAASNLRQLEEYIRRYNPVKEIKVV